MKTSHLLIAAAVALGACMTGKPASQAGQWLEADGPGETALVYRKPGAADFTLTCSQDEHSIRVATADLPTSGQGAVFFGAAGYPAALMTGAAAQTQATVALPVDDGLLRAIGQAHSVRMKAGDLSVETGQDTTGRLAAFADACRRLIAATR